ncbi:hypothetical protein QU38_01020, partial [Staphylococcus aureus]
MQRVQFDHHRIAPVLGDDRGGGDRQAKRVAADHGMAPVAPVRTAIAVDQHEGRGRPERLDRASHRQHRRPEDVQPIDLLDRRDPDSDLRTSENLGAEPLAPGRGERLGIVDALGNAFRVEHHGGGDHRAGERPTP